MSNLLSLKKDIISFLVSKPELANFHIMQHFPFSITPLPLNKSHITVGFDEVSLTPSGFFDYIGQNDEGIVNAKSAVFLVNFEIYVPTSLKSETCYTAFESLCDALMLSANNFGFKKLMCSNFRFDRSISAFILSTKGEISALITHSENAEPVSDIKLTFKKEGLL